MRHLPVCGAHNKPPKERSDDANWRCFVSVGTPQGALRRESPVRNGSRVVKLAAREKAFSRKELISAQRRQRRNLNPEFWLEIARSSKPLLDVINDLVKIQKGINAVGIFPFRSYDLPISVISASECLTVLCFSRALNLSAGREEALKRGRSWDLRRGCSAGR